MTVPCSYIFDIFIKKDFEFNIIYLFGLICLIVGFGFIFFEYWVKKKMKIIMIKVRIKIY